MKTTTTNGKDYSFIDMCDCGFTGGCEKCHPNLFEIPQKKIKGWGLFEGLKITEKEIKKAKDFGG